MQSAIGNFDQEGVRISDTAAVSYSTNLTIVIPLGYTLFDGFDVTEITDMCLLLCAMLKNGATVYELQQRIMGLQ